MFNNKKSVTAALITLIDHSVIIKNFCWRKVYIIQGMCLIIIKHTLGLLLLIKAINQSEFLLTVQTIAIQVSAIFVLIKVKSPRKITIDLKVKRGYSFETKITLLHFLGVSQSRTKNHFVLKQPFIHFV